MARLTTTDLHDYLDEIAPERDLAWGPAEMAAEEAADYRLAAEMDASLAKWLELNGTVVDSAGRQVLGFADVTADEVDAYCRRQADLEEVYGW